MLNDTEKQLMRDCVIDAANEWLEKHPNKNGQWGATLQTSRGKRYIIVTLDGNIHRICKLKRVS